MPAVSGRAKSIEAVMDTLLLWHIPLSHYNEKARWALDYKRIPHHRQVLGADYLIRAWRATGRGTLPILFLDGRAIGDSTHIIAALEERYPEPPLYPGDAAALHRALALEDYFDEQLGPALRAAIVTPLFRHEISDSKLEADRATVNAALDRIEQERQGRAYLVGDAFTVADLTAAAMLGALLQPPEIQYPLRVELPPYLQDYRATLLQHPATQWAASIYRLHRGRSAEVSRRSAAA